MTSGPDVQRDSNEGPLRCRLILLLKVVALAYAFLAGLRTITDYDLGWQLANARWVVQHQAIPSADVLSYTAEGQPWIYPIFSGLVFYGAFLLGGYALLSWLGAAACAGTVAVLLRRGSAVAAAVVILAIPRIAARTTPRAEMFTVVLFAASFAILWQQYQTGRARLWLLPLLMIAWVNLHLGFAAGLVAVAAYVGLEIMDMAFRERAKAMSRLREASPWLLASVVATLVNPWGWGIYRSLIRQENAMQFHSQWITEWAGVRLNWASVATSSSLRDTEGAFLVLSMVAGLACVVALLRREPGAAGLLVGVIYLGLRHVRLQALSACVVVVVAGSVLASALDAMKSPLRDARVRTILATGATAIFVLLALVRAGDLVSNRHYLSKTDTGSFGAGLSWWFPERAAAFIEREDIPGQIFNSYDMGGYVTWRLGPKYRDYIDGRAIPFGPERFQRQDRLPKTPPDSLEWEQEADRYDINTVLVSLARYDGLQFFPMLKEFCTSRQWAPVFLDEVSAVFVRHKPETEGLIQRFRVDCDQLHLPALPLSQQRAAKFNQWANAAAVLQDLGRYPEAFSATSNALDLFPGNAIVHFVRANALAAMGNLSQAEQEYQVAVRLEPSDATWSALAQLYRAQGRFPEAIQAFLHAVQLSASPHLVRLNLAYLYLETGQPDEALLMLDQAVRDAPPDAVALGKNQPFRLRVALGRVSAWRALGDLDRAIFFQEEVTRLAPGRPEPWRELATFYRLQGRTTEAEQATTRAETLEKKQQR